MDGQEIRRGRDRWRFVSEFARSPLQTAAIAPSSPALAAAMTAPVAEQGDPVVVELGPGTGSFTAAIQHRLRGRGTHLAIELNPRWAALLHARYPGVEVICDDASAMPRILAERGLDAVDVVVSGLPWAAFPIDPESSLPAAVARSLAPDGAFTQFTYSWTLWSPPAKTRLRALRSQFEEVQVSPTVWRNLPPSNVYLARRAKAA